MCNGHEVVSGLHTTKVDHSVNVQYTRLIFSEVNIQKFTNIIIPLTAAIIWNGWQFYQTH